MKSNAGRFAWRDKALVYRYGEQGIEKYKCLIKFIKNNGGVVSCDRYAEAGFWSFMDTETAKDMIENTGLFFVKNNFFSYDQKILNDFSLNEKQELTEEVKAEKKRGRKKKEEVVEVAEIEEYDPLKVKEEKKQIEIKAIQEEAKGIPAKEDFIKVGIEKGIVFFNIKENEPNRDHKIQQLTMQLEDKYTSWVANKWRDGNNSPIKNWKSKIGNIIVYFKITNYPTPVNVVKQEEPKIGRMKESDVKDWEAGILDRAKEYASKFGHNFATINGVPTREGVEPKTQEQLEEEMRRAINNIF